MEKKIIIVKHWEIYIKLKWFLERTVGKKPILLWDILMLFRMRTREKSSCLNYCAKMILLGSSVPFPLLDINSYYLRVDSFHFRTIILFSINFHVLFSLYSQSHSRWLDVHLITMRCWHGTPSDAPICPQGRGHKKLSCWLRSHCEDCWLWNV